MLKYRFKSIFNALLTQNKDLVTQLLAVFHQPRNQMNAENEILYLATQIEQCVIKFLNDHMTQEIKLFVDGCLYDVFDSLGQENIIETVFPDEIERIRVKHEK